MKLRPIALRRSVLDKKDRSAVLAHCLTMLSPAHREIIDLVYYHEKSVEEVAEIAGIPAATVKTRMHYARKRLARLLKETGISTSAMLEGRLMSAAGLWVGHPCRRLQLRACGSERRFR